MSVKAAGGLEQTEKVGVKLDYHRSHQGEEAGATVLEQRPRKLKTQSRDRTCHVLETEQELEAWMIRTCRMRGRGCENAKVRMGAWEQKGGSQEVKQ